MYAMRALARHGLRAHWVELLAIVAVLAAGVGAGLASLEIAERTSRAYEDYRRSANVAELVVNPSVSTDATRDLLASIPGVESVTSDALLTAAPDMAALGLDFDDLGQFLQVRVSTDGRYTSNDRPAVRSGRMVEAGDEAFLSEGAAASLGLEVGDTLPLIFVSSQQNLSLPVEEVVASALDTVEARVVGIGSFPDEVLPDELIPREKILVTPDLGERFDCLGPQPEPDDPRSIEELFGDFFPPDCSASYHYFSLDVAGGDAGAVAVGERIRAVFDDANAALPAAFRENDIGYFLIPSFTADEAKRLEESLGPVVAALRAFALTALAVSAAGAVLLVARHARRREADVAVWRSLGMRSTDRAVAMVAPSLAATSIGFVAGLLVAFVASGEGAVASAATVDIDPARGLSDAAVLAAATAVIATLALMFVVVLVTTSGRARRAVRPARAVRARSPRPALTLGIRAARRGAGALAVLVGSTLAVTTVTATLVFSAGLVRLTDDPERFGWPYDVAVLVNAGYDDPRIEAVADTLDGDRSVARWGRAALSAGTQVNGSTVPLVGMRDGFAETGRIEVVEGRLPTADDEVAVGRLTARDLGIEIGDQVEVTSDYGDRQGTVTGFAVLPAVGPLEADRASLGTGLLLSVPFFDELAGGSGEDLGLTGREIADSLGSFVVIDLEEGVDAQRWLDEHAGEMTAWDPFSVPPLAYAAPVRPPVVIDIAAMQRFPGLLAAVLAAAMAASVVAGVAAGTRARRRELAILRALGGSRRMVRASVRWHALAVVGVGLASGLPLGVALGRVAYGAFARSIGAAHAPVVPLALLGVVAVVVVALGLAAAVLPGRWVSSGRTVTEALAADAGAAAG